MNSAEYIKNIIDERGLKQYKIAEQMNELVSEFKMSDNKLSYKLKNNSFTADELVVLGMVLNIDLNKLKEEF